QHRQGRRARFLQARRQYRRSIFFANHATRRRSLLQFRNNIDRAGPPKGPREIPRRRNFLFHGELQRNLWKHAFAMRHRRAARFDNSLQNIFRTRAAFHVARSGYTAFGRHTFGATSEGTIAATMLAARSRPCQFTRAKAAASEWRTSATQAIKRKF